MAATILLSGGLDSTILLHHVAFERREEPLYLLSFNYGQRHNRELDMARWQARQVPAVAEHRVADMSMLAELLGNSSALLATGESVPDLSEIAPEKRAQPPTYVPHRNLILLSLAAAYAESRGCPSVYYGAQAHDQYGYWDCTPEFIQRANSLLSLNRSIPVTIKAPFAEMSKADEILIGQKLGVDFSKTWSCYRGDETPCGTCPTCVERSNAFKQAGIRDPLVKS